MAKGIANKTALDGQRWGFYFLMVVRVLEIYLCSTCSDCLPQLSGPCGPGADVVALGWHWEGATASSSQPQDLSPEEKEQYMRGSSG